MFGLLNSLICKIKREIKLRIRQTNVPVSPVVKKLEMNGTMNVKTKNLSFILNILSASVKMASVSPFRQFMLSMLAP